MKMQGQRGFSVAYSSIPQDISGCNMDIDRFLREYGVVLSVTNNALRFLTMQIVSVLQSSIYRESAQANAGVSTRLRGTHRCCGS